MISHPSSSTASFPLKTDGTGRWIFPFMGWHISSGLSWLTSREYVKAVLTMCLSFHTPTLRFYASAYGQLVVQVGATKTLMMKRKGKTSLLLEAVLCYKLRGFRGLTLKKNNKPYNQYVVYSVHPGKLTWNLKITELKRKIIFSNLHFLVPCKYLLEAENISMSHHQTPS